MGRLQGEKGGVGGKTGKSSLEQGASAGRLRLTPAPPMARRHPSGLVGAGRRRCRPPPRAFCDFGYDFSQMTKMCIVTPIVGGSTEFSTRPAHGVGVPRGAGGRAAAFHTSLPGLESVVPIGACLGAQQGQQGWCCYRCCLGGGK